MTAVARLRDAYLTVAVGEIAARFCLALTSLFADSFAVEALANASCSRDAESELLSVHACRKSSVCLSVTPQSLRLASSDLRNMPGRI